MPEQEQLYPILATDFDNFVSLYILLDTLDLDFSFFYHPDLVYVLYVYSLEDYFFIFELLPGAEFL